MISIMLPFWGDPAMLRDAVHSVIEQTDPRWRLTVVDDHYPDPGAADWVRALDDPRIHLVRNPVNLGVSANFAACLALADAEYVTFLGCDDLLGPTYVAEVLAAFERHRNASLVQPGVSVIDEVGAPATAPADRVKALLTPTVHGDAVLSGERLARSLLHGNWTYFPSIAWRRSAIADRSFRQDMETVLDFDLLLSLVLSGHELVLLEASAFRYRRHSGSVSSLTAANTRRFVEEATLYSEAAVACRRLGWTRAARAAQWHLTSRLHAALLLPSSVRRRERPTTRALVRHLLARSRR